MQTPRTHGNRNAAVRRANAPQCPLRYGEPCTLCQAFVTGPEDCQTVALVMEDPDLKAQWVKGRSQWARERRLAKAQEPRERHRDRPIMKNPNETETKSAASPSPIDSPAPLPGPEPSTPHGGHTGGLITGTPRSW